MHAQRTRLRLFCLLASSHFSLGIKQFHFPYFNCVCLVPPHHTHNNTHKHSYNEQVIAWELEQVLMWYIILFFVSDPVSCLYAENHTQKKIIKQKILYFSNYNSILLGYFALNNIPAIPALCLNQAHYCAITCYKIILFNSVVNDIVVRTQCFANQIRSKL